MKLCQIVYGPQILGTTHTSQWQLFCLSSLKPPSSHLLVKKIRGVGDLTLFSPGWTDQVLEAHRAFGMQEGCGSELPLTKMDDIGILTRAV